jgi:hypothetical protein
MGNVIDFLERLGSDARLRYASGAEVEQALELAQIDSAARAAILAGQRSELEALLGAQANVCCLVRPGDEDDEEEDDEEDDDADEEEDELSMQRVGGARATAAS